MAPPKLRCTVGLYLYLTTGRAQICCTLNIASTLSRTRSGIVFKLWRHWWLASIGVALASLSLATVPYFNRGGPGVYSTWLLNSVFQPRTFRGLVHGRPGQGFAEGASHSKGVHPEVALQLCRSQMAMQSGRHTGCGEQQTATSTVITGKWCPAVKSHPLCRAAVIYAVTARNAHIARQSAFTYTVRLARGPMRLTELGVEDQTV